jgi:hypothetical protein
MHKYCIHPIGGAAKIPVTRIFIGIYDKKITISKLIIAPPVDAGIHHLNPVKNLLSANH